MRLAELTTMAESTPVTSSSHVSTREEKYPVHETKITPPRGYPVSSGPKLTAARKLQALRQHVLEDPEISAELAYYVPPNGQSSALSTESDPLQPWIEEEFLHSEARVLLLKAPGGAGKSTFNRHLLRQLWQDSAWAEWKPGEVPPPASVPIFIPLGSSQVNPKRLLTYLSHLPEPLESFTDEELNVLKEDYQLLLIADGYDEIPGMSKLNLYDANSLGKYQGRVKLLISSRDFIGREPVESAQLAPHALDTGRTEYAYYRERWVSSFNESQIADYLERYLAKNKERTDIILWSDVATYQEQFKAFPELKPLISAPFLLWIAAEALPSIVQGVELELKETAEKEHQYEEKSREKEPDIETKSSSHHERKVEVKDELKVSKVITVAPQKARKEITRLRLYAQFMEQWFYRQAEKAVLSKDLLESPEELLSEEGMIAVQTATGVNGDLLAAEYLKQAYRQFCQLFANYLQASKRTSVQYPAESKRRGRFEELSSDDSMEGSSKPAELPWATELFGPSSKDWQRVRQGCPLRSAGNEHQFLHASLTDYFVATIPVEQTISVSEEKTLVLDEKNQEQLLPSTSLVAPEPILSSPGESFLTLKTHPDIEMTPLSSSPPPPEPVKNKRRGGRLAAPVDPATQRLLDPKTIGFRVDELKDQPEKSQHYWDLIERSKTDENSAIASANAATVLNASGSHFIGRDWQGVRIPGADLSYGVLAHINLSGADLTGAYLQRSLLLGANLQGASLERVYWGELPLFRFNWEIYAIAYHPFEPWLAVVQSAHVDDVEGQRDIDSVVELVHLHTGEILGQFSRHTGGHTHQFMKSISFSSNGQMLAGGVNNIVRLWLVSSRQALGAPLIGHDKDVNGVSFSLDGQVLASGSSDKTVRLWSVSSEGAQALGAPLTGHNESVNCVSFNSDGQILASGSSDETVRLWSVSSEGAQALGAPLRHKTAVRDVSFSPDGQTLAASEHDGEIRLWSVSREGGRVLGVLLTGSPYGKRISFNSDGKMLASTGGDREKTVQLWSVSNYQALGAPLTGHTGSVTCVSFSPDGQTLASGGRDYTVRLWTMPNRETLGTPLSGHNMEVSSVSFSSDGQILASGSNDRTVRLWSVSSEGIQALGAPLTGHNESVSCVSFNLDGQILASGSWDKTVRLWSVSSKGIQALGDPLIGHTNGVKSVSFSPDGKLLASVGSDYSVRLWSVSSQEALGDLVGGRVYGVSIDSVLFSPDGQILASGGGHDVNEIRLWSVSTRKSLGPPLKGHTMGISGLSFSLDGQILASGSGDSTVRLWSVEKLTALGAPLTGHKDGVESVSFSPDGDILVSGGEDGTMRLWSVSSRHCLQILQWQTHIQALIFHSPRIRLLGEPSSERDQQMAVRGEALLVIRKHGSCASFDLGFYHAIQKAYCQKSITSADIIARLEKVTSETLCSPAQALLRQALFQLSMAYGGRGLLAMGDWNNLVSLWSLSMGSEFLSGNLEAKLERSPPQWTLISTSLHPRMQLCASGTQMKNCRMSRTTQRLLQQRGADEKEVQLAKIINIIDGKPEDVERKTGSSKPKVDSTLHQKFRQESKYEIEPLTQPHQEVIDSEMKLLTISDSVPTLTTPGGPTLFSSPGRSLTDTVSPTSSLTVATELQPYNPHTTSSSTSASSSATQSSLVAQSSFQGSRVSRLKAQLNLPTEQVGFNSSSTRKTLGNSSTQN